MDRNCLHNHSRNGGTGDDPGRMDAAHKSLADALHVSFRLLGVAMVLIVFFWLTVTGMSCIDTSQRAVRVVLGKIAGEGDARVHADGLLWNWPEPFGKVIRVSTKERALEVNNFWMYVPPGQAHLPVDKLKPRGAALTPGQDGALLTGDRGIIHVVLTCNYKAGVRGDEASPRAVLDYIANVKTDQNARDLVRSVVSTAAVHAAADRTVKYIQNNLGRIADAIRKEAQDRLDDLNTGITLSSDSGIEISKVTLPLAVLPAFVAYEAADQDQGRQESAAKQNALKKLEDAAGASWRILAGDLDVLNTGGITASLSSDIRKRRTAAFDAYERAVRDDDRAGIAAAEEQIHGFGLLSLYAQATEDDDKDLADRVLNQIDRVLMSNRTQGGAGRKIQEAREYAVRISKQAEARAEQFTQLLPSFKEAPELTIQRLWADAKTEILANKKMEKFYVPRAQRFVLQINEDPAIRGAIDREKIKARKAKRDRDDRR